MRTLAILAAALALAGCDGTPTGKPAHPGKARVLAALKDPSSAQFRNETQAGESFCAEVNAKNSMGGYVGFRRVIATGTQHVFEDGGFATWNDVEPGMTEVSVAAEEALLSRKGLTNASVFQLPQEEIRAARDAAKFEFLWARRCKA